MKSPRKQGHLTTCTRAQGIPDTACEWALGLCESRGRGRERGREGGPLGCSLATSEDLHLVIMQCHLC